MKNEKIIYGVLAFVVLICGLFVAMSEFPEFFGLDGEWIEGNEVETETRTTTEGVIFKSEPTKAKVIFEGQEYLTPTSLIELEPGKYDYEMSKIGFKTVRNSFTVNTNYTKTVMVYLETKTQPDIPIIPDDGQISLPLQVRFIAKSPHLALTGAGFVQDVNSYFAKTMYLKNANIHLEQETQKSYVSYDELTSTGWLDFEHEQAYGGRIQYTIRHNSLVGGAVSGSVDAPNSQQITYGVDVLPSTYGMLLTWHTSGELIGDALPCIFEGKDIYMADITPSGYITHKIYVRNYMAARDVLQGTQPDYQLAKWMFLNEAPYQYAHIGIRGSDGDANYLHTGAKTMYVFVFNAQDEHLGTYRLKYMVSSTGISQVSTTKVI